MCPNIRCFIMNLENALHRFLEISPIGGKMFPVKFAIRANLIFSVVAAIALMNPRPKLVPEVFRFHLFKSVNFYVVVFFRHDRSLLNFLCVTNFFRFHTFGFFFRNFSGSDYLPFSFFRDRRRRYGFHSDFQI